jgi:AcrR family transcriptional regulator
VEENGVDGLAPTAVANFDALRDAAPTNGPARTLILNTAIRLFCRDGISVTGVDTIIREAGVARMTLYNQFGSKEGLLIAALEHESATWRSWFFARVAALQLPPFEHLLAIFDVLKEWFGRDDYFGCALMNAVLESRTSNEMVMTLTTAHKKPVVEQLKAMAAAAGADNPTQTAGQMYLIVNGAIVNAILSGTDEPADDAKSIARALLTQACGRPRC